MKHGCTVALAAVVITGLGISTATAECNPRNPTACTAHSQPKAEASGSQAKAAAPLQLKRFIKMGPARRSGSRSGSRHAGKKPAKAAEPPREAEVAPTASAAASAAPLTPKAIPTVSISAPALALTPPAQDRTVGHAATAEPWTGGAASAAADEPALASGMRIARFDEVNEIDLAADAEAKAAEFTAKFDHPVGVSLITPANAAAPAPDPEAQRSKPEASWLSWAYSKLVDGMLAAVLAIRSIFV